MIESMYVMAFESTHAAMAAYHALAQAKPAMIPTPKAISAGCGMSLRFAAQDASAALALAESVGQIKGMASLYADEDGSFALVERL
ncbi:MAG: DUF3343 domain-containing protein [Slackia faecicanis]|nr:DUF3343 domain-containing protein [Slackia faecicanis]